MVESPRIVIAAFNEAKVIRPVVEELVSKGWAVIVVDDGSVDATAREARVPSVTVVTHCTNLGQGAALQTGIDYAVRSGADVIVTFDADAQHDANDIPRLLASLADHDIVLGSRFLGDRPVGATRARHAFLRLAAAVSNRLSGLKLTDAHCGLRAFRVSAVPALEITQNRMAHASELLHKIKRSGLRVTEVPVTVRYTEYSRQKGQSAMQAIRILFDYCLKGGRTK